MPLLRTIIPSLAICEDPHARIVMMLCVDLGKLNLSHLVSANARASQQRLFVGPPWLHGTTTMLLRMNLHECLRRLKLTTDTAATCIGCAKPPIRHPSYFNLSGGDTLSA